jgi:hypothetical protein
MRLIGHRFGLWMVCATIVAAVSMCSPAFALADLLTNGDFSAGHDNSPQGWHTRVSLPSTEYVWTPPSASNPGQVEIANHLPNDGRWIQPVFLPPGWYYISAENKVEGVPQDTTGAFVGLTDEGVNSPAAAGDTDWQRLAFYLEVGKGGANVEIVLALGNAYGFSNGNAYFREVSVAPVDGPVEDSPVVFHLDAIRKSKAGSPLALAAALALLAALACAGWYLCAPSEVADK